MSPVLLVRSGVHFVLCQQLDLSPPLFSSIRVIGPNSHVTVMLRAPFVVHLPEYLVLETLVSCQQPKLF